MPTLLLLLYLLKLHKVFWNLATGITESVTEAKKTREKFVPFPTLWHDAVLDILLKGL